MPVSPAKGKPEELKRHQSDSKIAIRLISTKRCSMYLLIKRFFDVVFSLAALLLLFPFMLPVMLILKFTGEGSVFFLQQRIGYKNRYFHIIKFATMVKDGSSAETGLVTLRNDPRLLPLGRFLRITKLDELPQILNVLKGDMSIVGPRPLVDNFFKACPQNIRYHVYNSKPGITGIGSVIFRNEAHLISGSMLPPQQFYDTVIAPYKGELEIWYNKNKSFLTDIKIIFITVWVILFPTSKMVYAAFPKLPKSAHIPV